jgi:four helix bundle protein
MQELEETVYWLELLEETGFATLETLTPLKTEADELMAIFVTIARKTKAHLKK